MNNNNTENPVIMRNLESEGSFRYFIKNKNKEILKANQLEKKPAYTPIRN